MVYSNQYRKELQDAVQRTVTEKYIIPLEVLRLMGKFNPYFNVKNSEALYSLFSKHFSEPDGTFDLSKIKGQCLKCHPKMAEMIKRELGVDSFLTVGYVNHQGNDLFKFNSITDPVIRTNRNNNPNELNIHVWLTLPSFEIIDFTFMAHWVYVEATDERKKLYQASPNFIFNFGNADQLYSESGIIYHPIYIGDNVLIKGLYI